MWRSARDRAAPERGRRLRRRARGPAGASLLLGALLGLVLAGACGDEGLRRVPPEIHGTWRSEDEPYARRYLEIRADRLVFGASSHRQDLELETLEVLRVRRRRSEEGEGVFRLRLRAPQGYDETMVLRYRAQPEPTLRIARRDATWRRAAP